MRYKLPLVVGRLEPHGSCFYSWCIWFGQLWGCQWSWHHPGMCPADSPPCLIWLRAVVPAQATHNEWTLEVRDPLLLDKPCQHQNRVPPGCKWFFIVLCYPTWTKDVLWIGSLSGTAICQWSPQWGTEECPSCVFCIYKVTHLGDKARTFGSPEGSAPGGWAEDSCLVYPMTVVDGFWSLDCRSPGCTSLGCASHQKHYRNWRHWEGNLVLCPPPTCVQFSVNYWPNAHKSPWTFPSFLYIDKWPKWPSGN